FAPYVGGGLGVAFDVALADDNSGYSFGTKGMLIPHVGVKWFPVHAFAIKVEGRGIIWRLSYPTQFFTTPIGYSVPPVLTTADPSHEWTIHPTIMASIGYTFVW